MMAKLSDEEAKVSEITRRKVGRPPKGTPKRAVDYGAAFRMKLRKFTDFAAFLEGYPDTTGIMGYWYRLRPRIDNGRIGVRDAAILKTSKLDEMTEEFCARKWGQGSYMLKLADANRPQGRQDVATTWAEIDDPDMPPVYDVRTLLVSHPDNADEVARLLGLGVLVRDATGLPAVATSANSGPVGSAPVAPVPPAAAPAASALSAVASDGEVDTIGKQVLLKLLDRALPSATPQTADTVLEQSFRIADRLAPRDTRPAPTVDEIVAAVEARLNRAHPPASAVSLTSELETYERVEGLLSKFGAGRGSEPQAAAGDPLWLRVLSPLIEGASRSLLPLLVAKLAQPSNVVPMRAASGLSMQPAGAVQNGVPAVASSLPVLLPADAPLMERLSQVAQLAVEKQAAGVEGFRFASWLCGFYPGGDEIYQYLDQRGGATAVMGFLSMVPELQARLADQVYAARLEEWLNDFFSYDPLSGGADVGETAGADADADEVVAA